MLSVFAGGFMMAYHCCPAIALESAHKWRSINAVGAVWSFFDMSFR
jgi:hypothetical protein